ncbi:MAG: glycosyltransferase [Candidatus Sigynarchaeota archaeon]
MRIAFVLGKFPSLSETFILDQITGLIQRGHTVDIFSEIRPDDNIIHEDVRSFKLEARVCYFKPLQAYKKLLIAVKTIASVGIVMPRRFMKLVRGNYLGILFDFNVPVSLKLNMIWENTKWTLLYECIRRCKKYDIIHCHFGQNGIIGAYLKYWGIPGKLITSFYGTDLTQYIHKRPKSTYNFLFKMGDLFLPICNYFRDILVDLGCDPGKIKVHHIGVDPERFIPRELKERENKGTRLLSIGRLVEKKGASFAIKAIARIVQDCPDVRLSIVGDGPDRKRLESLVKYLRVEKHIYFLGPRDRREIQSLYADSDIFLLPSVTAPDGDKEGTPTVLMEAQAMQLPVVSTLHSGIPEVVHDGVSGLLIAEKDVEGIVHALKVLIHSPEKRAIMGVQGRAIVTSEFNNAKLIDELVAAYSRILR